ncbi:MAG: hypothetical protein QXD05_00105 [Candidatus Pacearchaeota archaeon]
MKINKDNVEIASYLVGMHAFNIDHNYENFKSNLINDLQYLFNLNFKVIRVGGLDILKVPENKVFEIQLTPNSIVYQDIPDFKKIIENSKKILDIWKEYSPKIKLSLVGLITNFKMKLERPVYNRFILKEKVFRNFQIGEKLKGLDFHIYYVTNYKGYDYNIHFSMSENIEKEYILQGMVDFNEKTENKLTGITDESCDRIFSSAKKYFEEEILEFLNKNGN